MSDAWPRPRPPLTKTSPSDAPSIAPPTSGGASLPSFQYRNPIISRLDDILDPAAADRRRRRPEAVFADRRRRSGIISDAFLRQAVRDFRAAAAWAVRDNRDPEDVSLGLEITGDPDVPFRVLISTRGEEFDTTIVVLGADSDRRTNGLEISRAMRRHRIRAEVVDAMTAELDATEGGAAYAISTPANPPSVPVVALKLVRFEPYRVLASVDLDLDLPGVIADPTAAARALLADLLARVPEPAS